MHRSTLESPLPAFVVTFTAVACFCIFLLSVDTAHAQGMINPTISLSPSSPSPGESVTATISMSTDLRPYHITWKVNGTTVQQSSGGTTYTFTAGNGGQTITLSATAALSGRETVSAQMTYVIQDTYLVWEANTYTPILYRGRSLASPSAEVTAVVIPNIYNAQGKRYDPTTLVYTWRINANAQPHAVGRGLTHITTARPRLYAPLRVSVHIADSSENTLATRYVDIPVTEPFISLYEDSKLGGPRYANALGREYVMTSPEVTFIAEPFFMSAAKRDDPKIVYNWKIGDKNETSPGSIVLRPEGVGEGRALIQVVVTNQEYLAQRLRGELSVLFRGTDYTDEGTYNTTGL